MKKLTVVVILVCFAFSLMPGVTSYAQGKSGVSSSAVTDESVIDKIGDWFATRGKSDAEKQKILAERKMKRMTERTRERLKKVQKKAREQAQKQKNQMDKNMKGMKKGRNK